MKFAGVRGPADQGDQDDAGGGSSIADKGDLNNVSNYFLCPCLVIDYI